MILMVEFVEVEAAIGASDEKGMTASA